MWIPHSVVVLLGFSIPEWCWSFQLKRLVEHCWVSGQENLGGEDPGPRDVCVDMQVH